MGGVGCRVPRDGNIARGAWNRAHLGMSRFGFRNSLVDALVVAVAMVGCGTDSAVSSSSDAEISACTPGRQVACACASGAPGAQICNEQGTAFLTCNCAGAGIGDDGGDVTTSGNLVDRSVPGDGFEGLDGGLTDLGPQLDADQLHEDDPCPMSDGGVLNCSASCANQRPQSVCSSIACTVTAAKAIDVNLYGTASAIFRTPARGGQDPGCSEKCDAGPPAQALLLFASAVKYVVEPPWYVISGRDSLCPFVPGSGCLIASGGVWVATNEVNAPARNVIITAASQADKCP